MPKHPGYPFIPKSTAHIRAGDFWAIPLRRGGWFACGRVLYVWPQGRVHVVIGLLDWCEPELPTADTVAGAEVLAFGHAHIKSIKLTGGPLLGNYPLQPGEGWALGGSTWGYLEIERMAHSQFGRHFPEHPSPATERPSPLQRDRRGL